MANVSKAITQIKSGVLTITEGYRVTKVYKAHGGDLIVEQDKGDEEDTAIMHYGGTGTRFYVALLKFLYVSGEKEQIPKLRKPEDASYDEYKDDVESVAKLFAAQEFPINYMYWPAMGKNSAQIATFSAFYRKDEPPELQVDLPQELRRDKMIISVDAAKELIKGIARLYHDTDSFRAMYVAFLREAAKYPEQVMKGHDPEEKGEQLGFDIRDLKREGDDTES